MVVVVLVVLLPLGTTYVQITVVVTVATTYGGFVSKRNSIVRRILHYTNEAAQYRLNRQKKERVKEQTERVNGGDRESEWRRQRE